MLREDKYKAFVDAVVNVAGDYNRGMVIPWAVVERAMGRGRDDEGGRQIVKRAVRRILSEREIVIRIANNVGLCLLTDEEAAEEVPRSRQKRAYRQLNRGLRELAAVRVSLLSDAMRLAAVRQRQCMAEERREIGRSYREIRKRKRTETHPVRVA